MDFEYKILVVSSNPQELEEISRTAGEDFPRSAIDTTTEPQDAVDFCRANVYDLIIADAEVAPMRVAEMVSQIREMSNDNLDTGVLIVGEPQGPVSDLSNIMFAKTRPLSRQEYLQCAKILISLKKQ